MERLVQGNRNNLPEDYRTNTVLELMNLFMSKKHLHIWRQLLVADKRNRNGDKFRGLLPKFCNEVSIKLYTFSSISNKYNPSLLPCWLPVWGVMPIPENLTRQTLHKNNLHKLQVQPKILIITYLGDINAHPQYQLTGPTDIH